MQSLHACEAAARESIEIVIEPINGRDIPGYLMNDFHLAARLIRELNLPNFGLQFDIYHRQILHGDVTRGPGSAAAHHPAHAGGFGAAAGKSPPPASSMTRASSIR